MLDENTWGEIESGENNRKPALGVFGRAALTVDQGRFVRKLVKGIFQEPRQQSSGFYTVLLKAPLGITAFHSSREE